MFSINPKMLEDTSRDERPPVNPKGLGFRVWGLGFGVWGLGFACAGPVSGLCRIARTRWVRVNIGVVLNRKVALKLSPDPALN